jgi:hypothetical protein
LRIIPNLYRDFDKGWPARRQRSDLADSIAAANGLLKSTSDGDKLVQKAEGIQQIGLPCCVGANDKTPTLKLYVDSGEIPPVSKP